jgi:hypothetical protein
MTTESGNSKITVLNPRGTPPAIQRIPMAPRNDSLDGKTIYLVDARFPGGDLFHMELKGWFERNMPEVSVILREKKGSYFNDDPELWAEIKENGHGMVITIGH